MELTKDCVQALLQSLLKDRTVEITESLQSLWSGYGQIFRCYSKALGASYVVKMVSPPTEINHPRGWNTDISHRRKLISYEVESRFYQNVANTTDSFCKVPKLLASHQTDEYTLLVLEDLDDLGFDVRLDEQRGNALVLALRWLAYFHAKFSQTKVDGLWDTGSYWHLATRQDEWNKIPDGELKQMAGDIDKRLNQANFKTLIHGDAKFANFCFHHQGNDIAAVDFQYVGYGSPVKDLAYLVAGCLSEQQLETQESFVLSTYLTYLQQAFEFYDIKTDFSQIADEIRTLYCFGWADFYRFLVGWNPQSHKMSQYMKNQTQRCLSRLREEN